MQVRCNVSIGNPVGLSIGSVAKSEFQDNDFGSVSLSGAMRDAWGSRGNTWEGGASAPEARPPRPRLDDCSPGPVTHRIWGDVNLDGVVDATDATLVLRHAAGLATPEADLGLGDVDADSEVTTRDALILLHYADGSDTGSSRVGTPAD
jgi:hypothetical protein